MSGYLGPYCNDNDEWGETMHTKPMSDDEGRFTNEWVPLPHPVPCRHCGVAGRVFYRNWESNCGGYDDAKFECRACGEVWWVEGPDA